MNRAAVLICLAACSAPVEIQLQPEEGARALLLAVEGESGELELRAFDEEALERPIRASGELIHALFYERTLFELRLEAGVLSVDANGGALAVPDAIFRISRDGRERLEVEGDRVQRVFAPVLAEFDVQDEVRLARAIEGWGPLLGTRSGRLATRVDAAWSVMAFRGGIVFGGEDGVINQVYPGPRLCAGQQVGLSGDAPFLAMVELNGELYAFPRLAADVPLTVVRLTPL